MTDSARAVARVMYAAFDSGNHAAAKDIFTADFCGRPLGATGPDSVTRSWRRFRKRSPKLRWLSNIPTDE
ncbi:nuclear transport factor 2 family protein [Nocardia vaccinii]|uniref:nuclear transport factor 2 family protein n=1 Tax=Nocardia vaccinii TaxID=1822 RepID=UPI000AE57F63|nr:nuclear transport factor 2 family protein [Nocardia vaccinii]